MTFAAVYMQQPLNMDYVRAGLCLVEAVYFIFGAGSLVPDASLLPQDPEVTLLLSYFCHINVIRDAKVSRSGPCCLAN